MLAGCGTQNAETVRLRRVAVVNDAADAAEVEITVVRNGANQFRSEFTVPAGTRRADGGGWPSAGESFVVVGQTPTFSNTEITSLDHENDATETPHEVRFLIDERGDLRTELVRVDEA